MINKLSFIKYFKYVIPMLAAGIMIFSPPYQTNLQASSTPSVVTTIHVGGANDYLGDIAVNPKTNLIYVIDENTNAVCVIDGTSNTVTDTIDGGGSYLSCIAINPDTNLIYVGTGDKNISVIDGTTNSIVDTITLGSNSPGYIAINPNTNFLYVANSGNNGVSVIDSVSKDIVATVNVGNFPTCIAVNPVTDLIYITNEQDDSVSIINAISNTVISTITGFLDPAGVAINTDTNTIYVANFNTGPARLSIIDGNSNNVTTIYGLGDEPKNVAVNSNTNLIFVTCYHGGVSVVDGASSCVVASLPAGGFPEGIAINLETNMVYASSHIINSVTVINGGAPSPINTTTSITSSSDPLIVGQQVTFTANVSIPSSRGNPLGTVTFFDGLDTLGTVSFGNTLSTLRTATLSISTLTGGTHTISAVYNGYGNLLSSTGTLTQTVLIPGPGNWSTVGSMNVRRVGNIATLLPSGKVLVAGGWNRGETIEYEPTPLSSAELYDPITGNWTFTGNMKEACETNISILLKDGKVLVLDNYVNGGYTTSTELYDPATGTWSFTGNTNEAIEFDNAILLPSGQVLVEGGWGTNGCSRSAELYDPTTGTWSSTGNMTTARGGATATLLPNGKVLVSGGGNNNGCLSSAELYDPSTGIWSVTGSMAVAFANHTATLLKNGMVLVVGGSNGSIGCLSSVEQYDPATGTWSLTGNTIFGRANHTATILQNGMVLVSGGVSTTRSDINVSSSELFDPNTGIWSLTGSMTDARAAAKAILLNNGNVLVVGGANIDDSDQLASAELYSLKVADAAQSTLIPTSASLTADGSSTQLLTVQAKDSSGNDLTEGGATVTITQQSGTGTISPVTDNGNGTYTATVTAPTIAGSGVFVATLGGNPVKSGAGSQTQSTITYVAELASGSWSQMSSGTTSNLLWVWGSSSSDVYAVGSDGTILHFDGASWSEMVGSTTYRVRAVWGSSASNIFGVGGTGGAGGYPLVLHFDGHTWSSTIIPIDHSLYDIFSFSDVWCSSPSDAFAIAGGRGGVFHYDGNTWSLSYFNNGLSAIWGTSSSNVYAVDTNVLGYGGGIYHFNGNTWSIPVDQKAPNGLSGIFGTSDSDIYAIGGIWVGPGGGDFVNCLHYDGNTWNPVNINNINASRVGWGTSSSDIFTAGDNGFISHYDGISWEVMSSGTANNLDALWGSSSSDVFAVGANGTILHYSINNSAPTAFDDKYSVNEDTTLNVPAPGVLGNDLDADSETLIAIKVGDPVHGSISFNSDGSLIYTPFLNYFGSDSFSYKANDGLADSNVATVTITINKPTNAQFWYLDSQGNPMMEKTAGIQTDSVIVENNSVTWLSNVSTDTLVSFDTGTWTVHLNTTDLIGDYSVWIGESDGTDEGFQPFNTDAITGTANDSPLTIEINDITAKVPQNHYLALRITNSGTGSIITDGSSYLCAPSSVPPYPVPELSTCILFGVGIVAIGTVVIIKKNRVIKS
jgi:YVTN family beta-propeller protein